MYINNKHMHIETSEESIEHSLYALPVEKNLQVIASLAEKTDVVLYL